MIRVLMFISSLQTIGGMERQALSLAGKLKERGVDVAFLTWYRMGNGAESRERLSEISAELGLPIYRFPMPYIKGLSRFAFFLLGGCSLVRMSAGYDIIHAYQLQSAGLAAAAMHSIIRRPLVVKLASAGPLGDVRRLSGRLPCRWRDLLLKRVDRYVAITGEVEGELLALGVPARRIARIPNGVDLVEFALTVNGERGSAGRIPGVAPETRTAVYVGSIKAKKRVDFLLRAWKGVMRACPDARLLVVGGGPLMAELRCLSENLGLAGGVSFPGWIKDVRPYLRAADLLVLPSVSEGLPNSVLQACATGLPVVVTRSLGSAEVVSDGVTGYLFSEDSVEELTERVVRLLRNREKAREMGRAGRVLMEEKFSIDSVADSYVSLYGQLMKECGRE